MLEWFAIPFSGGPRFVGTLHHDSSVLGAAAERGSSIYQVMRAPSPQQGCDPWSCQLQYFGHLLRKTDSLEKTLMLGEWRQEPKLETENEIVR